MVKFGYKVKYNIGKRGRFTSLKTFFTKKAAQKHADKIKSGIGRDWYKQAYNIMVVKNK